LEQARAHLRKIKFKTQVALQLTTVGGNSNSNSNDCRGMPSPVIVLLLVPGSGRDLGGVRAGFIFLRVAYPSTTI